MIDLESRILDPAYKNERVVFMYHDSKEKLAAILIQLYKDWENVEKRILTYDPENDVHKQKKIYAMLQECQRNKQAVQKVLQTLWSMQGSVGTKEG